MEGSQIPNQDHNQVNVASFAAKFRSKAEVYQFMTLDVKAYLPAPNTITVYFLKDLVSGTKKCKYRWFSDLVEPDVEMRKVVHISVPAYENLCLDQIFTYYTDYPPVMAYLPEPNELRKVPKAWICNVGATIIGAPFFDWVKQRIDQRNANLVQEKNLAIAMDPMVARAFHASTAVSGKYHHRKSMTINDQWFLVLGS